MMKIFISCLVCDYVDIGSERPMDFILTSPSEDPSFPVVNILQSNGKYIFTRLLDLSIIRYVISIKCWKNRDFASYKMRWNEILEVMKSCLSNIKKNEHICLEFWLSE